MPVTLCGLKLNGLYAKSLFFEINVPCMNVKCIVNIVPTYKHFVKDLNPFSYI